MNDKNTKKPTEWALKHYGGVEGIKKARDFGNKLAQAMVNNLNKETAKSK